MDCCCPNAKLEGTSALALNGGEQQNFGNGNLHLSMAHLSCWNNSAFHNGNITTFNGKHGSYVWGKWEFSMGAPEQVISVLPIIKPPPEALHCSCSPASSYSPDLCQNRIPANSKKCTWHRWIDDLVHEVRCEICAERLFCAECSAVGISPFHGTENFEQLLKRKREQNRAAAQRYRHRKTRRMERERHEIGRLEARNAEMRAEKERLRVQIAELKTKLAKINGRHKDE